MKSRAARWSPVFRPAAPVLAGATCCAIAGVALAQGDREAMYSITLSDNVSFIPITCVDPGSGDPIPLTIPLDASGEFSVECDLTVDNDPNRVLGGLAFHGHSGGETGINEPGGHFAVEIEILTGRLIENSQQETSDYLLSILPGMDVADYAPGSEVQFRTTQEATTTGQGEAYPESILFSSRVFAGTADNREAYVEDAAVSFDSQAAETTLRESGWVDTPPIPDDSTEETFVSMLMQTDIAIFGVSNATDGALTLTTLFELARNVSTGIPGDYNEDGVVNAADYVLWREKVGAPAGTLPNDTVGGEIGDAQYQLWVDNFGATLAPVGSAGVPEPAALGLLAGLIVVVAKKRRSRSTCSKPSRPSHHSHTPGDAGRSPHRFPTARSGRLATAAPSRA